MQIFGIFGIHKNRREKVHTLTGVECVRVFPTKNKILSEPTTLINYNRKEKRVYCLRQSVTICLTFSLV